MYNVIPQREPNGLTVVELFAGGGLMAAGLHASGYNIVWANDFDKSAVIAYRHNHGDYILQGDITQIDPDSIPDADIIAGGPPCQDYSVAGQGAGEDGERGKLVWTYLSIIERKQPKAFIFENVKGLVGKSHKHTFDSILEQFNAIGYKVAHKVVNAWEHGVAQKRERVFVVGIRTDLGFRFMFPDPLPEDYRTQVLRDVIGDLPDPVDRNNINVINHINIANDVVNRTQNGKFNGARPEYYVQEWDEPCGTVTHTARSGDSIAHPNHDPQELSDKAVAYLHSKDGRSLKKHRPPTLDEPGQTIVSNIYKGVPYGLHYPDNHDPQELSDKALCYMNRNWEHRGSRIKDMDEPGATVSAVYAKGVPYGLFYPDNHEGKPLSAAEEELAQHIPNGGNWKDIPYDQLPDRLKRIHDEMRKYHSPAFYKKADWDEPAGTISATMSPTHAQALAPDGVPNHEGALFDNVNLDWSYEKANRPAEWDKPGATVGGHARNEGIHPAFLENHDRWKKLTTDAERLPQLPESISTVGAAGILGDVYMQNYAKAGNDEPALTVAAIGYPKPHPKKPRRFTVRECLRIQSVPDWYVFPDSISLSAQYRVVGNGVASRVAYLLGIALADQLKAGGGLDDGQVDLFDLLEEPNRRVPRERTRDRKEGQA